MQMVCLQSFEFWCSNVCGNFLVCGNYICRSICYFVIILCIVVGEEVFQFDKLFIFFGIELGELINVFEGVWGKYGVFLFYEKCISNGLIEDILN